MNPPPQPPPDSYGYGPLMPYEAAQAPPGVRRHRLLIFVRRFWWVPVITAVLALGAGYAYVRFTPPVYVSDAIMLPTGKLRVLDGSFFTEDAQNYFGNQMGLLQSAQLQALALQRLRDSPTNQIPTDDKGRPRLVKIKAAQVPKSGLIRIEATGPTPTYSRAFLDALMLEFLEYKRQVRARASSDTMTALSERIDRQEQQLKTNQVEMLEFQRTNDIAVLEQQLLVAGSQLALLGSQLETSKRRARLLEAAALEGRSLNDTNGAAGLTDAGLGADAALGNSGAQRDLQVAQQKLAALKIERDQPKNQNRRPKHSQIIKLDEEIQRTEKLVEVLRSDYQDRLAAARQALQLEIETYESSIKDWQTKLTGAKTKLVEFDRLKQSANSVRSLRDDLLPIIQSLDVNRNIDQEPVTILQYASVAEEQRPVLPLVLAIALVIGLGVGVGIIFLVELANDRLMSTEDLSNKFTEELVGQLPDVHRNGHDSRPILVAPDDPRHIFAESCRCLRSSLLFGVRPEGGLKTLLVTSAEPAEGKTTVAANLALILAFGGARVLLVDADLRRSSIHRLFNVEREPGLGNLLEKAEDPERYNCIRPTAVPNLYIIPSGKPAKNCGELLLSKTFTQLLEIGRDQFDYVIFDTIPVFASDDATTLAPKMDGVLFVVRSGFSRSRVVRQALELLYQRQAKVLGLVFNRADARARSYPYYRYAEYYDKADRADGNSQPATGDGKPSDQVK